MIVECPDCGIDGDGFRCWVCGTLYEEADARREIRMRKMRTRVYDRLTCPSCFRTRIACDFGTCNGHLAYKLGIVAVGDSCPDYGHKVCATCWHGRCYVCVPLGFDPRDLEAIGMSPETTEPTKTSESDSVKTKPKKGKKKCRRR